MIEPNLKPKDICEYKDWLKEKYSVEIDGRIEKYYDSVSHVIKSAIETSSLFISICSKLEEYDDEYIINNNGYSLLSDRNKTPILEIKSFESFLFKTFRKNVLENSRWPDQPEKGWIFPQNWFVSIKDIVRTTLVVKYLDGIEFLIGQIGSVCEKCGIEKSVSLEAREEGYYAAHLNLFYEIEIPKMDWDSEKKRISFEIQITTQIQETIRRLLHKYYEENRRKEKCPGRNWQWNYKDDEFIVNYLGHILHYMEGMIMEIRERRTKEIKS